ncbi:hypothetical protein [Sphingobacterium chuzhouense]|nr:hypothetical protein [Sphingobacterium chuzhouense]
MIPSTITKQNWLLVPHDTILKIAADDIRNGILPHYGRRSGTSDI